MNFSEFEVKFLVGEDFDAEAFFARVRGLGSPVEKHLDVTDTYYVPGGRDDVLFRHRHDREIQHLTVKSRKGDIRQRTEINLHLTNDRSQKEAVDAFLSAVLPADAFEIRKVVDIFDFPDCEIVHYRASGNGRSVRCVEFEAVGADNWAEAARIIDRYVEATDFGNAERSEKSLFELIWK